jgi:AraC family transcriptional regulator of adaptative response / DNA-3-methyladenine glycosylase II
MLRCRRADALGDRRIRDQVRKRLVTADRPRYRNTVLDPKACWRALQARDARFDGRFFVGVSTTGVYCRPICPARTPRRDRCSFHPNAAVAEKAGFRACFRCRPELAPGHASIDAVPRLVASALGRIDEGYLDGASVDALARELGVSGRHLRRVFEVELGVSPIELAQTRRLARAKQLLHDSELSLTAIAYASGFRSLRRFNTAVLERFGRPPSELRRLRTAAAKTGEGRLSLRLDHRAPLDFPALLEFLRARALPGIEVVDEDSYCRRIGDAQLRVWRHASRESLSLELDVALAPMLARIVAAVRRLFDLDAEPQVIAQVLRGDRLLAPLVRRRPGLRVPGGFDPFETALRAVLGQQVSVAAATTLSGRLLAHFDGVPSPHALARSSAESIAALGLPLARARALVGLADAWDRGAIACAPGSDPEQLHASIVAIPGLGAWTAEYLSMRALHFPDALPAGDLALRKALGGCSPGEVRRRAQAWRPWRAYAAIHLWTALAHEELP